jgi:hypothetical protein
MEINKLQENSSSPQWETNILHKCRKCKNIITTEFNIHNYRLTEEKLFKNSKFKKTEFLFFIKDSEGDINSNNLNYTLSDSSDDKKILCKNCKSTIGYYKKNLNKTKIHGILKTDAINSENIKMNKPSPNKRKIEFVNKLSIDNLINIKKVKSTNEIISSFTKDFFRHEMVVCSQILKKMTNKIDGIYKILEKNEI